jgi:CheY-like chemotaxis protein
MVRSVSRATILVVEDDAALGAAMVAFLEDAGYRALLAGDGDEALALLRREAVDAILLDLRMPRRDGWELFATIRRLDRLADVPILIASGVPISPEEKDAINGDGPRWLEKPFSGPELLDAVQHLCGSRKIAPPA